ncbi:MAG: hypothetical protein FWC06_00050 [Treponema sp.]|nr:hypothetical protein [Treponema sp.]
MSKKYKLLIFPLLFFITFGVRVYWLSEKDAFHVDEGMSIAITCYKDYLVAKNYITNIGYTGKELKDNTLVSEGGFTDAMEDIKNLWKDNRDPPHTNLYYTFLRLSFTGLDNSDIKPIIFRGGILNLILFSVSFVFFVMLIKLLFPGFRVLQHFCVICAFLSTASITNTLFLRPYQIQETMFIILTFYFIKTIDINKGFQLLLKPGNIKTFFILSLITAVTLITGYYAVIFIGLLGLYVIYKKSRDRKNSEIIFYVLVLIFSLILAHVFYPGYFKGFNSYRATETTQTIFANTSENLKVSLITAWALIHKHFFSFSVIAVCVICLLFALIQNKKLLINKYAAFIFCASLLYYVFTLIIAPYKVLRYGMPVFPFFVLLPAVIFNSVVINKRTLDILKTERLPKGLRPKTRSISITAMIITAFIFLTNAVSGENIEHLYKNKQNEYLFTQHKETPVFVFVHEYSHWKYGNLVPYLNDEQKYIFIRRYSDIFMTPYNEFYLVIENVPDLIELSNPRFTILESFELTGGEPETPEIMGSYFICRKVILKDSI